MAEPPGEPSAGPSPPELASASAGADDGSQGIEAAGPGPGTWLELTVEADQEAVEAVSEILARVASGGVAVEVPFVPELEGLVARPDPSRPAIVRGYLPAPNEDAIRPAVAAVEAALGHLSAFGLRPIGELETRFLREADWASAWKAHVRVLRIGRRLVIRPSWRRYRPAADEVVVTLDPGQAFGTGLHPTTRLCLRALEDLGEAGRLGPETRVLDLGSGSGILALAAGKLGAGRILALDVDPIAVEATAANARRNGLADRVEVRRGSLPSGAGPFDVILANLVATVLIELAPRLAAELAPRGVLVASGIVIDRAAEVEAAFGEAGLVVADRLVEGDWIAGEWRRRSPGPGSPAWTRARPAGRSG